MTDLEGKKSNGFKVSVLTNGQHIIYEEYMDERNLPLISSYWHNPCYLSYNKNEKTIQFFPLILYSNVDTIPAIEKVHILFGYIPAKDITDAYKRFVVDFHQRVTEKQSGGLNGGTMNGGGTMSFH